jgi:hypothetical protein
MQLVRGRGQFDSNSGDGRASVGSDEGSIGSLSAKPPLPLVCGRLTLVAVAAGSSTGPGRDVMYGSSHGPLRGGAGVSLVLTFTDPPRMAPSSEASAQRFLPTVASSSRHQSLAKQLGAWSKEVVLLRLEGGSGAQSLRDAVLDRGPPSLAHVMLGVTLGGGTGMDDNGSHVRIQVVVKPGVAAQLQHAMAVAAAAPTSRYSLGFSIARLDSVFTSALQYSSVAAVAYTPFAGLILRPECAVRGSSYATLHQQQLLRENTDHSTLPARGDPLIVLRRPPAMPQALFDALFARFNSSQLSAILTVVTGGAFCVPLIEVGSDGALHAPPLSAAAAPCARVEVTTLIGPPGTGKTRTILGMLSALRGVALGACFDAPPGAEAAHAVVSVASESLLTISPPKQLEAAASAASKAAVRPCVIDLTEEASDAETAPLEDSSDASEVEATSHSHVTRTFLDGSKSAAAPERPFSGPINSISRRHSGRSSSSSSSSSCDSERGMFIAQAGHAAAPRSRSSAQASTSQLRNRHAGAPSTRPLVARAQTTKPFTDSSVMTSTSSTTHHPHAVRSVLADAAAKHSSGLRPLAAPRFLACAPSNAACDQLVSLLLALPTDAQVHDCSSSIPCR